MNEIFDTIQRDSSISFPMLGNLTINPPASFNILGKDIYFYGVLIGLGFILGMLYCSRKSEHFGIKQDDLFDILIWMIPLSIVGARLYFVLFKIDYYILHPSEIMAVWEGGLAIYGGIIMGIIVISIGCHRKKMPVGVFFDLITYGLLIGQILGRWGNFMNREAFGAPTDVFCRMGLTSPNGTTIYVHPTFLYESLWNVGVFIILYLFEKKGRRTWDGQIITLYFLLYGLGRAWIEGLRTDSLYIGATGIRVSQALSIALVIGAAVTLYVQNKKGSAPERLYVNRIKAAQAESEAAESETKTEE